MTQRWWRAALGGVLLGLATLGATPGRSMAQEAEHYREVNKDGRIYVFSTAEGQKAWEASGEIGNQASTRLGYGPNGETVMFENDRAIELYNQKHGKSEAPRKEAKSTEVKLPFNVVWRAPGLRFSFPKFELNWSNRMQVRYTHELPENEAGQADRDSFRIRRFKTKLDGWLYSKNLTYELQLNWPDTANSLEDANIDYDFSDGKRAFRLKAGQYKVPFGRQELTSSGSQQFVDRSIVSAEFARGRDIGVQLWGQAGSPAVRDFLEWRVGAFNGAGRTVSRNTNDKLQYNARLMISPWGNAGYSESNLEGYPLRASFAVNFEDRDKILRPATGDPSGDDRETIGADVSIKAAKILSVFAEYFQQDRTNPAGATT